MMQSMLRCRRSLLESWLNLRLHSLLRRVLDNTIPSTVVLAGTHAKVIIVERSIITPASLRQISRFENAASVLLPLNRTVRV